MRLYANGPPEPAFESRRQRQVRKALEAHEREQAELERDEAERKRSAELLDRFGNDD